MYNELTMNSNFIHCSSLIAELLMKYKRMENEECKETKESEDNANSSDSFSQNAS